MKTSEAKKRVQNLEKKVRKDYTRKDALGCVVYVIEYIVPTDVIESGVAHLQVAMDELGSVGASDVVEHFHITEDFFTACEIIDTRKIRYD